MVAPVVWISLFACSPEVSKQIVSGETWHDTDGNPINAHGGGILKHDGKYYWYGEIKSGNTWLVPNQDWECYRVSAGGVSCYSSEDLLNWKNEGIALKPNLTDSSHDLHTSKVLERPKVVHNPKTGKFVMWLHVDSEDYQYSRAGVAIADSPEGPFHYLGSYRPNGHTSRDMTLFKDEDGQAYLIYASDNNANMYITQLSEDYLTPTIVERKILANCFREAPAMFMHDHRYYLITSGCTGWSPNAALISRADSVLGDWIELYNPCVGEKGDSTFLSQSTYILPLDRDRNTFVFLADRWQKLDLAKSTYVWLPLKFEKNKFLIEWEPAWRISK